MKTESPQSAGYLGWLAQWCPEGAMCAWPAEPYRPSDLTPDMHVHVREQLIARARRDGLSADDAEEAGSAFYLHWAARDYTRSQIVRGNHAHAYLATARYGRLSGWRGYTGRRRSNRRATTAAAIAARERLRARHQPSPPDTAIGAERLLYSPSLRRKAERLAGRLGLTVEGMVGMACGQLGETPLYVADPAPAVRLPATPDDGSAWRAVPRTPDTDAARAEQNRTGWREPIDAAIKALPWWQGYDPFMFRHFLRGQTDSLFGRARFTDDSED